jgi:hypothetical protein
MERRVSQGESIRGAAQRVTRRSAGKHYESDPARAVRISGSTLLRLYYSWKWAGKKPGALTLKYRSGREKLPREKVLKLARVAVESPARSFNAAYNLVADPGATAAAYRAAMPRSILRKLIPVFAARRKVHALVQAAKRTIGGSLNEGGTTEYRRALQIAPTTSGGANYQPCPPESNTGQFNGVLNGLPEVSR